MRVTLSLGVLLVAAGVLATAQGQGTDASGVLAAARGALGGEQKLTAVKTFVVRGRTRQVRGNNLVPIEFEIACELPDKYVRTDEVPAQESGPTSSGFNGTGLIQIPPPPEPPPQAPRSSQAPVAPTGAPAAAGASAAARPASPAGTSAGTAPAGPVGSAPPPAAVAAPGGAGRPPMPPPDPRAARVSSLKQDFVKLTLGMFATSFSSVPLAFTLAGQAEAPQGKADIVDVKGPGNTALRLFINSETHLPIMVTWTMPATTVVLRVPGQPAAENIAPGSIVVDAPAPPAATASKEDQGKYAKEVQDLRKKALTGARPVEYRIYYADYREAGGGLRLPFRLRRAIAGETVEETNIDEYKVNARIDARKFQVVK